MEYSDNSDPKLYNSRHIALALVAKEKIVILKKTKKTWYLDFNASQYLCKNRELFRHLQSMSIKFNTAKKKIIYF